MPEIQHLLPGRLADPDATLATDQRADPRIISALEAFGGFAPGVDPVAKDATYEACLAYCAAFEAASSAANEELLANLPVFENVTRTTQVISGLDGNEIKLFIHQPTTSQAAMPCVVHLHGGGMVLMSAADPGFVRWRDNLANCGMVVIGVEFRNGGGRLGTHPFPAGLNDCAATVQWVHANKADMNISSIVISGESGGGNLSLATTLLAKQQGWLSQIDGVYAMCPYISGCYANPPVQLLSLYENDGYLLDGLMMGALAKVYDPTAINAENPLAWPYHAQAEDLAGLPPHIVSVNELDPLRDEGLAYYRKLMAAGVSAVGRTVHGTPHGGDQAFPDVIPNVYLDTVRSMAGFAHALQSD